MLSAVNLFSLFGTWAAEATQSVSAIPRRPFTKTVFPTYMSSIRTSALLDRLLLRGYTEGSYIDQLPIINEKISRTGHLVSQM